jgi:NAD(P)-dependent dehydrogenase (short-subunit alcohol dehydrogenase family)
MPAIGIPQEVVLDLKLAGKKAVVTGGSRGIGKAIAGSLAAEGCDVSICARNEGPLRESAAELTASTGRKIVALTADMTDAGSIKAFIQQSAEALGGIDILINSAARVGGTGGAFDTVTDADILQDFQEKVLGYFRCAKEVAPYMKEAGWGRIINISGGAGRSPGNQVSGGMRNVATVNLTKSLANNLGPFGINVNAIYPGGVITEVSMQRYEERARTENTTVEALMQEQADRTLIKHLIDAEDIASVVTFLCSPLSIRITGEAIAIMGGSSADVHY